MSIQEPQKLASNFPWRLTTVLYGLSFAPQLFSANKLYWDDWTILDPFTGNVPSDHYLGTGSAPWRALIESTIFNSSPIVFRLATFITFFASGYFLFHILSRSKTLTHNQVVIATIIFLVVPVNSARIALITNTYSTSYFLFFLGWFLLSFRKRVVLQLLGFVSFFLSYTTIGAVTFTVLPVLYFLIVGKPRSIVEVLVKCKVAVLLAALPVFYLAMRQLFWPPTSGYAEMYKPQSLGLIRGLLFVIVCSIPAVYGLRMKKKNQPESNYYIVSFGLFALAIAAFPYMVGGHLVDISDWLIGFIPNFSDWNSRHQLLLPFGLALIIVGSLKIDSTKPLRWNSSPVLSVIVACFVVLNITFAQEYFLDGKKQDSIMAAMADNADLKNASSILIDDSAVRFNARGRLIRSYEWEGMLQKVFGENSRRVSYLQYVNCAEFQPDAILHISAPNGRLESTLRRHVDINVYVEQISPCGN
jgi:hypothetical protein